MRLWAPADSSSSTPNSVCKVVGLDISEDMLRQAHQRASGFPRLRAQLDLGDLLGLPLGDDAVDVSVCVRFVNLVDIDQVEAAVGELARISRSYVILGVRTVPLVPRHPRHAMVRWRRWRSGPRVTWHHEWRVRYLLRRHGLSVVRTEMVDRDRGGSSYRMLLCSAK